MLNRRCVKDPTIAIALMRGLWLCPVCSEYEHAVGCHLHPNASQRETLLAEAQSQTALEVFEAMRPFRMRANAAVMGHRSHA